MEFLCIGKDFQPCLFEGIPSATLVPPQVVTYCHCWLSIVRSILLHHSHDFLNHPRFQGLFAVQAGLFGRAPRRQTARQIRMKPRLNAAISIHADEIFRGAEVSDTAVKFFEAIERAEKKVEILREGDVLDVTESNWDALDIDAGSVRGVTEVLPQLVVQVTRIHDAVLPLSPLKELKVPLELPQTVETQQVLLQLLVRQVVDQDTKAAKLGPTDCSSRMPLSPALFFKGWRFVQARFAAAHEYKYKKVGWRAKDAKGRRMQRGERMQRMQRTIIFSTKFLFSSYNYSQYFYSVMSSPSQLFSCVESDAILRSPINNSTAKNNWTFSKDSRFKRSKYYCDSFYEIPGVKQNKNRRAGFGYGKKTDLQFDKNPLHVVPPPNTYNLSTFIETNKLHAKGFTPRFSREEIAPMSYIQLEPYKVPGPGRYEEFRYNESPKWSLHDRTSSELFPQTTVKIVPGPGAYVNQEAIELNPLGQYHLSNHRNSKAKVFNPPRSRRFYKSSTDVPGADVYHPQNDLSNEGKYVLSKHVSAGKRKFMDGRRLSFTDIAARRSFTPGPGSYRAPSEFGQYDLNSPLRTSSAGGDRTQNISSKTDRTKATEKQG